MKTKAIFYCILLIIITAVLFNVTAVGVFAEDEEPVPDIVTEYSLIDETHITLTKYVSEETVIAVPSEIDGYTVSEIAFKAFEQCVNATEIIIPDSVSVINGGAFYGCNALQKITVSEKNEYFSTDDGILYDKQFTRIICVPAVVEYSIFELRETVTSIDAFAFYNNKIQSIKLHNNVTSIDENAFSESGITTVYSPKNEYIMQFCESHNLFFVNTSKNGWVLDDGKWYYYLDDEALTGLIKIGTSYYYFNKDAVMTTGWVKIEKKWRYFDKDGIMQKGFQVIDGDTFYLGTDGIMVKGWKKIDKDWYYFNKSGKMLRGLRKIDSKTYYLGKDGKMQKGWQKLDKSWYYFNKSGEMVTGFNTIKEKVYYFNSDGKMAVGLVTVEKKTYFFKDDGVMATGLRGIDGSKYLFAENGEMLKGITTRLTILTKTAKWLSAGKR